MVERRRPLGRAAGRTVRGGTGAALAFLLVLLAACGRSQPELVPRLDLVDEFAHTQAARERDHIDLATPAGETALVEGWSRATGDPPVVWTSERHSSIRLALGEPADRRLRFRCGDVAGFGPFRPRSPVYVSLNRRRIGMVHAGAEMAVFELRLPKEAQRRGENLLELEHPKIARRRGNDDGPLRNAVAYDWIEIETQDPPGARARLENDGPSGAALVLPAGARLDYLLRLPEGARLTLGATGNGEDAPPPALRVDLTREDGSARTLLSRAAGAGEPSDVAVDLGTEPGEIVELSLSASGQGSLRLRRPVILGAAPAADRRPPAPSVAAPTNVLIYVIDTLRADHLGAYGYPLPTSPHIDALARQSLLFERVIAQASWTKPAVAPCAYG
jgi:hypothetical protein